MEERVPAAPEPWRAFFAGSLEPCFVIAVEPGPRFVMAAVNAAYERHTGLTARDVVGRNPLDALDPETRALAAGRMTALVASGTAAAFVEPLRFPSGERVWRTHLVPVRGADGPVVAIAGMAHDMTESLDKERAQAALADSEQRYRRLAENAPDVVFRMRLVPEMGFEYVNRATIALTGHTPEEHYADPTLFMRTLHPEDRPLVRQRIMSGRYDGVPLLIRVFHRDGAMKWIEPRSVPIHDAAGRLVGLEGAIRDVTERQVAQQERELLERRLQETQKLESLGVLAGGIAHDFNNILTGILGSATLLRRSLPPGSVAIADVDLIQRSAERAGELCRQMLAYSGKARFVIEDADLGALARDTLSLLSVSVSGRVELRIDGALPLIRADATQIRQVIMNLVLNAAEAMEGGEGSVTVRAGARELDERWLREARGTDGLAPGRYVWLEVEDSGAGMSPETLARIFEPFFTTKFAGRGLGLSAVLGIVRAHHGGIRVCSEPGRGSTFTLVFPPAAPASERPGARPAAEPPAAWRGQGTVLVVDDGPGVRRVGAEILRACGFEVIEAGDGAEGLTSFRAHSDRIVAVLMDLTMPAMDGESALEEIRRLRADVPVVLMSGHSEQHALRRFAGKGVTGFVQKPFGFDALVDGMRAALRV